MRSDDPAESLRSCTSPTPITGDRFRIPSLGINASFVVKAVPADGQLPEPPDPFSLVMYDFGAFPDLGGTTDSGNAVVAGDFNNFSYPCPEPRLPLPCGDVFWSLDELDAGHEIQIEIDGHAVVYLVETLCWIAQQVDFRQIVRRTDSAVLTIITAASSLEAGGVFSHRLVVWASASGRTSSLTCGSGEEQPLPRERYGPFDGEVYEITSSLFIHGELALVRVATDPGAACAISLRSGDGVPVFGVPRHANGDGRLTFTWEVWDGLPEGPYAIEVDCGKTPESIPIEIRRLGF